MVVDFGRTSYTGEEYKLMSQVFYRHTKQKPPLAVRGEGPYVFDHQQKRYLDACCGAAVSSLGYCHPTINVAMKDQIDQISYAHTQFFSSEPAEKLADFLVSRCPGDISHVYYSCGGSESIEAALKLARQYYLERGQPGRKYFIARTQSYHGNTLGALAVGGNVWRRKQYQPLLIKTHHISPCYAYRGQQDVENEYDYGQRVANELKKKIEAVGAENIIGFVFEPVVGATLGAVAAVEGYLQRIRQICDEYDILMIADEVMCGMGRTGSLFALSKDKVSADLVVIAKGLGGGYQPISALLVARRIYNVIEDGSGFFQHGHTYMGHPLACATALAVQNEIESAGLLANVVQQGDALISQLRERMKDLPFIGDIRGRGLFIGVEFVADCETKSPIPAEYPVHTLLREEAMRNGLLCYTMAGTIDGVNGHHVLIAPPFIISSEHAALIVDLLSRSIDNVFQRLSI